MCSTSTSMCAPRRTSSDANALRQDRPQRAEDFRGRVGHARRLPHAQLRRGPGRCGLDDGPGAQQRHHRDGQLTRRCWSMSNPGGMQWETDLIGYDAMKSYGSPATMRRCCSRRISAITRWAQSSKARGRQALLLHHRKHREEATLPEAGECLVGPAAGGDQHRGRQACADRESSSP